MDPIESYFKSRPPTADQPLLGLTLLLVEDSRFAAEGFRLLCLRSGARIRRADSLASARRHLGVYRPSAVLIDVGLPDGSGTQLIAELARAQPRVDAIIAISGDPDVERMALDAGADGFIAKPITSIAAFQSAVLAHLPRDRQPPGPRALPVGLVAPDTFAFREDMAHAAEVLAVNADPAAIDYVTQFLGTVARSAGDHGLIEAVGELADARSDGAPGAEAVVALSSALRARLVLVGAMQ